jgi:hypothetical protein
VFNNTVNDAQCTVCFPVDDLKITCSDQSVIDFLSDALKARFGKITMHTGDQHYYLGALFDFSVSGKVKISLPHHPQQIIDDSDMIGTATTPAASNLFDIDTDSPLLVEVEQK